ncbi:CAP domain-containing protein [Streptomyces barkulensis]|uniref:CAP domain-containing protein n=1 Tax=Streptomyces barkulensis TaxID=1257026 RepID=UPI000C6CA831|nr:CAP domain-containing protein [Streptomyces barkulensis]
MSPRRAGRSRHRSHARPKGAPPARNIVLALGVVTMAAGAGLTVVAGGGQDGPADRVAADAADTAHDTEDAVAGGASPSASSGPDESVSASPGADRAGEPVKSGEPEEPGKSARGAAPSASAPASGSTGGAEPDRAARSGQSRTAGSEGTVKPGGGGDAGAPGADTPGDGGPQERVLALVNRERAAAGCRPVTADARLARAAEDYSDTMAASGVLSHTGPDGSTMAGRVEAAGYAWSNLGENIAQGQPDAASVMKAWMNSPGHRANILNCAFEELGVGVHFGDGGPWWTQNFGTGR